ncbi:secondary thiamine-phosphate synthase enzyme YjbQ [Ferrimonas balearica]|uniref:secondary thiamine-phosphate synthase enzyme YjbQ n=1 Tax=Ferrimonas balearica TaxID=44012 RepID=UPI001C995180|nr:secondary thiamine-phosphate synthase enzyme YjbQ [Ferrimonas balearica]MBY5923441.1 secondary thiamine-phosphate synthase enzyme YjbQ [Ferrimonas balearica]MBY5995191.1 secondary thiamine-phosphate synthase enzyme YjbQ [Ferrimonas balearica]
MTQWIQTTFRLPALSRGFHLITDRVESALPELSRCHTGLLHLFIQHSSASLTINENADPTVRTDFESHFNQMVPEHAPYYRHTYEGPDDMPAHLKASLLGSSVSIPVNRGRLLLGTWQGIYLGEHRDQGGSRTLVATLQGDFAD